VTSRQGPTAESAAQAVETLLGALESGSDVLEALKEVRPLHPKNDTFPGEVFIHLAAQALSEGGVSPSRPISEEGLVERFLPEVDLRGWENQKFRSALMAGAATHAGVKVDLLEETTWWRTDDFWNYAGLAAVVWIRTVASDLGLAVAELCRRLRAGGA